MNKADKSNASSPVKGAEGLLYIVPTPIGNLKDITLRALDVLKGVDLILAEDTRTTSKLLNHYQINKALSPYHQHNEHQVSAHLVDQLSEGKRMALVTDAGTPGISDPAFLLIRHCIRANVKVECLPGATAFVPALVNSGIPSNRFVFEGFLPLKKGRQTMLKKLAEEERTMSTTSGLNRGNFRMASLAVLIVPVHLYPSDIEMISCKAERSSLLSSTMQTVISFIRTKISFGL